MRLGIQTCPIRTGVSRIQVAVSPSDEIGAAFSSASFLTRRVKLASDQAPLKQTSGLKVVKQIEGKTIIVPLRVMNEI